MATARTRPAFDAAWYDELERIWQELETPEGSRAELIDGEIIVSPSGSVRHSGAISALIFQLVDLARTKPGQDKYARAQRATAGQPLRLTEPFGIELDTARLLA